MRHLDRQNSADQYINANQSLLSETDSIRQSPTGNNPYSSGFKLHQNASKNKIICATFVPVWKASRDTAAQSTKVHQSGTSQSPMDVFRPIGAETPFDSLQQQTTNTPLTVTNRDLSYQDAETEETKAQPLSDFVANLVPAQTIGRAGLYQAQQNQYATADNAVEGDQAMRKLSSQNSNSHMSQQHSNHTVVNESPAAANISARHKQTQDSGQASSRKIKGFIQIMKEQASDEKSTIKLKVPQIQTAQQKQKQYFNMDTDSFISRRQKDSKFLHQFISGKHDTAIERQTIGIEQQQLQSQVATSGIAVDKFGQMANEQLTNFSGTKSSLSESPSKIHRKS